MTINAEQQCFVYITLPGTVSTVTAGRFVIEKDTLGDPLGRFVFERSYLENPLAVDIDPVELKLSETTYETIQLNGVFGALRDAGPDFWGRRIIEKCSGQTMCGELKYLLESPDDRAGALGFGMSANPLAPLCKFNRAADLERLQEIAGALIRDEIPTDPNAARLQDLLLIATAMGGARPKAVIEDGGALWIAKFERPGDRWNFPRVEHAMLALARECGINAAESKVETIAGMDILLVKRFDRQSAPTGYTRPRMISGLTALKADEFLETKNRWSYLFLADELRRIASEPKVETRELFRRICFNALISNTDDHPRNHAFVAADQNWELSPAYDLTPSPVVSQDRRDLAMECGDHGRFANAANILSQHYRFLLEREEAEKIVYGMREQVEKTWYNTALGCGVSRIDAETIRPAFVYSGFSRL